MKTLTITHLIILAMSICVAGLFGGCGGNAISEQAETHIHDEHENEQHDETLEHHECDDHHHNGKGDHVESENKHLTDLHDHDEDEAAHHDEAGQIIHLEPEVIDAAGIHAEPVTRCSMVSNIELTGTVMPHPNGEGFIGSMVEGRVKELFVDVGDRVMGGHPLCTIESPTIGEAEAAYITALAELKFLQGDVERHQTLVAEGIGSKKEQLELEAQLASCRSTVAAAERTLHAFGFTEADIDHIQDTQHTAGRVTLRSPVSGIVVERNARLGLQVTPDSDLFHVVNLKHLRIRVDVPELHIDKVETGGEVTIVTQNGCEHTDTGKIERITGIVNPDTRTVTAYVTIRVREGELMPGSFVSVIINSVEDQRDVIAVPSDAVFSDEHGDQLVYVEIEAGEFCPAEIETGRRVNGWVEILEGISEGARVVVSGAFALHSEALKGLFGDGHGHAH